MEKYLEKLVGININEPPLEVKHSELERADEDSEHKSKCPKCKAGVLLMRRHHETFLLRNFDNCILCGQRFIYTDIEDNKIHSLFNGCQI